MPVLSEVDREAIWQEMIMKNREEEVDSLT
jgi:hypothetical protein